MTRVLVFALLLLLACRGPRNTALTAPAPGCRALLPEAEGLAIDWIAAPDSTDRGPLDRWCAGVGPTVVVSRSIETPRVDSLAIVSWNTHVGGGDIAGLVRDLREGRLTGGAEVSHFVLLLQEAYRQGAEVPRNPNASAPGRILARPPGQKRVDIIATADRLGLNLYYVPSMANGRAPAKQLPEDRGNAILSTLPLESLGAIELPYEVQRRVAATAGVSGRTSAGEPWHLRLVSVHLDHRSRNARLWQSLGGGRARQARALVDALAAEAEDRATVLGGDLNTWSIGMFEGAIGVLEKHFPIPAESPAEPTYATVSGLGGMRLDRLMFRLPGSWAAETRRITDRYGSDHHPLLGWVRLAAPPGA